MATRYPYSVVTDKKHGREKIVTSFTTKKAADEAARDMNAAGYGYGTYRVKTKSYKKKAAKRRPAKRRKARRR